MTTPLLSWALELEYDGTAYMGWQRQAHGLAIQQVLEEAAAKICNGVVANSVASGRTDAGVHALAQIVQLPLPDFSPFRIREALNYHLRPHPVAVLRAALAPDGWSARFSAIHRRYRYVISNRGAPPTLDRDRVWHIGHRLDEAAMDRAAQHLLGHHDFSAFRASACQAKTPFRTLDALSVRREADTLIIEAAARSFLHHQVRNMVGSLKLVGEGSWAPEKLSEILAGKNRAAAGPTAPAAGLYFVGVTYLEPLEFS